MFDYIAFRVNAEPCDENVTDLISAQLGEAGFESFESDDKGVTAYIKDSEFNRELAEKALEEFPIPVSFSFSEEFIKGQDWNEEWEKNYFKPINIDGRCVIRSTFHENYPDAEYEIIIDPKMAFGTGHHFTTRNMVRFLLQEDLKGKDLIDMGAGTGILAILGKMRGAKEVYGIEIDPFAKENADENIKLNGVEVNMICGDAQNLRELPQADLFLANINRNIILADIDKYASAIKKGGKLILSGFYENDIPLIEEKAKENGFQKEEIKKENDWVAVSFLKL